VVDPAGERALARREFATDTVFRQRSAGCRRDRRDRTSQIAPRTRYPAPDPEIAAREHVGEITLNTPSVCRSLALKPHGAGPCFHEARLASGTTPLTCALRLCLPLKTLQSPGDSARDGRRNELVPMTKRVSRSGALSTKEYGRVFIRRAPAR